MIRCLTSDNYQAIDTYLEKDHINNVYIIHALQTYGLESKHAVFWGAFENGRLSGVLYFEKVEGGRLGSLCGEREKILKQLGKEDYFIPIMKKYPDRFINERRFDFIEVRPDQMIGYYDHPVYTASDDDIFALVDLYKTSELGD